MDLMNAKLRLLKKKLSQWNNGDIKLKNLFSDF